MTYPDPSRLAASTLDAFADACQVIRGEIQPGWLADLHLSSFTSHSGLRIARGTTTPVSLTVVDKAKFEAFVLAFRQKIGSEDAALFGAAVRDETDRRLLGLVEGLAEGIRQDPDPMRNDQRAEAGRLVAAIATRVVGIEGGQGRTLAARRWFDHQLGGTMGLLRQVEAVDLLQAPNQRRPCPGYENAHPAAVSKGWAKVVEVVTGAVALLGIPDHRGDIERGKITPASARDLVGLASAHLEAAKEGHQSGTALPGIFSSVEKQITAILESLPPVSLTLATIGL